MATTAEAHRADVADGPLRESKLHPPAQRTGTIPRTALVERLGSAWRNPVVVLEAPAGYGKTTVLAEWARTDRRPFGWLSIDESDNDPGAFLVYLAAVLEGVGADVGRLREQAAAPGRRIKAAIAELGRTVAGLPEPAVIVLDDVQALTCPLCLEALAAVVGHIPSRSQVVLATRSKLELPVERLRRARRVLELGIDDLRLGDAEAAALLEGASAELDDTEVEDLNQRCEGWPAGLFLAALALRTAGPGGVPADGFSGGDRFVSDYFRLEVFDRLSTGERELLLETSVLERLSGTLCDQTTGRTGSGPRLAALSESNLFVLPLDTEQRWFRVHHLFRDMLRAELERRSPGRAAELLRRACDWCEANGEVEAAVEYAIAAGDRARAVSLLAEAAIPAYSGGRFSTVERWFRAVDDPDLVGHHPAIAVFGAWVNTLAGRPQAAERWAQAAFRAGQGEPLDSGSTRDAWLSLLRAMLAADGVEAMREDAESAVSGLPPDTLFASGARLLLGFAHLLAGSEDLADQSFAASVELGSEVGATVGVAVAVAERALLAVRRGDLQAGEELVGEARQIVADAGLESYGVTAIVHTAAARVALARGRRPAGREEVERAERLVPRLTYAMVWAAAPTRLELAHLQLALGNAAAARALLDEIAGLALHRPDLGVVREQAEELRRDVESGRSTEDGWSSALTAAELRLLPLLATYLSFRQIGERLDISRNTVKTQAIAVYRKLGVSSRS